MQELTTTRHNELLEPFLNAWNWQIPVYLFLGGMVAGMMIIAGYSLLSGKYKDQNCSCFLLPIISVIVLSLGMLALFLDLEHKLYVWRLYTTFKITAPMSWGAWILLVVYPALIANILINPPVWLINVLPKMDLLSIKLQASDRSIKRIGIVNILLGILLGTYTGVLLSTLGARPLWNSSVLWLLFLVSGLSSASALVHMITKDGKEKEVLTKIDSGLLVFEIFVIIMMLLGLLSSSNAHIEAARLILSGPFAATFWVFVIGIGIIIPLILQVLAVQEKIKHSVIPALMVILGGLILRIVLVYAGQYSHYFNAHF